MPFAAWAEQEYVDTIVPTLLEAAEKVKTTWESQWKYGSLSVVAKAISSLSDAIVREKAKPVRNLDRYKTSDEAYDGFVKFYERVSGKRDCNFVGPRIPYVLDWIYAEAGKDAAE